MSRKSLVVGINHYPKANKLCGCVNDAEKISKLLERNEDGSKNFDVEKKIADDDNEAITKEQLKKALKDLFTTNCEVALFYFAGHGYSDEHGGYILTSECSQGDDGIRVSDITDFIQASKARNNIVILDCCQAGSMGNVGIFGDNAVIPNGATFLLACKENQYAEEKHGSGVFTDLLVAALSGGGANLVGEISPGSIYAYIDQALGLWKQRPVFKTNIEKFISVRKVKPPIDLKDLHKIIDFFPEKDDEFPLNPSYEPTQITVNEKNKKAFAILQKYNRLNLLVPVDTEHMYYAAIESKSCKLTLLGIHYWNLVKNECI